MRARDLVLKAAHVTTRRGRFFSEETRTRFETLNGQILSISRSLGTGGIPNDAAQKEQLLNICYDVMVSLTSEAGRLLGDIERIEE